MKDVNEIFEYIRFLEKNLGLEITLHPLEYEPVITASKLSCFNIHSNPYCLYLKGNTQLWKHCISRQKKIQKACSSGSFCGTCFAGVKEYVYPLMNGECIGFISVSGYKDENGESYIKRISQEYRFPLEELRGTYERLKELPPKSEIDIVVDPLCRMLELAYSKRKASLKNRDPFISNILHYLQINHTQNLSIQNLCEHFNCSRSQLCHSFKLHTNQTVTQYIKNLRISDAKNLLTNTKMSVTDIAVSIGFDTANYFSTVFKSETGLTPKQYRSKHQ